MSYTFLFYDVRDPKHRQYYDILVDYFDANGIHHYEYERDRHLLTDKVIDKIHGIIQFNRIEVLDAEFHKKLAKKPFILIDHGSSYTKWFLMDFKRYSSIDYFLVAGPEHKKSMEFFFGKDDDIISAGFLKSESLFQPSKISKEKLCEIYNLNQNEPIVLYAPTWFLSNDTKLIEEHNTVFSQLELFGNYIVSLHPGNRNHDLLELDPDRLIKDLDSSEVMKCCDVVISDQSSLMSEALAINKKTLQVLMPSYSDNPSKDFRFPLTAGTCNYFVGGVPVFSENLSQRLKTLDHIPNSVYELIRFNVLNGTYMQSDATVKIVEELLKIVSRPFVRKEKKKIQGQLGSIEHNERLCIAHAGGMIKGEKYTNSLEAVISSAKTFRVIELDVIKLKDGYGIAHDNFEEFYGLSQKFATITEAEFKKLKFKEKFSTLLLSDLKDIVDKNPGISFVLDIKDVGDNYLRVIDYIASHEECKNNFIPQVYSIDEYKYLESINYPQCLFALWKRYDNDPFCMEAFEVLKYVAYGKVKLFGISLRHANYKTNRNHLEMPFFYAIQSFGVPVYIHDLKFQLNTMEDIFKKSCGVFCHSQQFSFLSDRELLSHIYILYKILLKRSPEGAAIHNIFNMKEQASDLEFLYNQIQGSPEYKNRPDAEKLTEFHDIAKLRTIFKDKPKITNLYELMTYVGELHLQNIFPTSLVMVDYQPILLSYTRKNTTPLEIYAVFKKAFWSWNICKLLYVDRKNPASVIKNFYKGILKRECTTESVEYWMTALANMENLFDGDAYKEKMQLPPGGGYLCDSWDDQYSVLISDNEKIMVLDLVTNVARLVCGKNNEKHKHYA